MYDPAAVMDHSPEQRIEAATSGVRRLYAILDSPANDWDRHIASARSIIAAIDTTPFMYDASRADEQAWLVNGLQGLAYHEADAGGVADIAEWCVSQWLQILQNHPAHVGALQGMTLFSSNTLSRLVLRLSSLHKSLDCKLWILYLVSPQAAYSWKIFILLLHLPRRSWAAQATKAAQSDVEEGLGQAWLARAQHSLARIHRDEGSSSSGHSSSRTGMATGGATYTSSDEARDVARAAAEADARLHTADYVEARGILLPSTEYFSRAVDAADRTGQQSGDLLALVRCACYVSA